MSVMTENTLAGSGGLLRCANNALMDWIMSPSSGQAIIWCWLTESNRRHPAYKAGALPAELNQKSGSGLCACRVSTCRAARLYPRALTGSQA